MEKLNKIGLLCNGLRGLVYLEAFIRNGAIPGVLISHGNTQSDMYDRCPAIFWKRYAEYHDIGKNLDYYLSKFPIEAVRLDGNGINSREVKRAIFARPEKHFIFSGGGIIDPDMFGKEKDFIHLHPGMLPEFRGSTCYYYSMLKSDRCAVTAFFMEKGIDTGDIIMKKTVKAPRIDEKDWIFFDILFDPWLRAQLLYDLINSYKKKRYFDSYPQDKEKSGTYFVIHPVLKNLAIKRSVFFTLFLLQLAFPAEAHAYLNPEPVSYVFQLILAALMGGLFMIKISWNKAKNFFKTLFRIKDDNKKD